VLTIIFTVYERNCLLEAGLGTIVEEKLLYDVTKSLNEVMETITKNPSKIPAQHQNVQPGREQEMTPDPSTTTMIQD